MQGSSTRVIIDTNLWISFLITKDYSRVTSLILSNKIVLIFSKELLDEFLIVIKRPKLQKYFLEQDILNLTRIIDSYAEFINVKSKIAICRDKKDDFLLSLAVDSNADYLLTGDKDLLELQTYEQTKIVTIKEFVNF